MRIITVVLLVTVLACSSKPSVNNTVKKDSAQKINLDQHLENQITCWGIGEIELEDNYAAIEDKVGKNNIAVDSLFLEGNFERLITILWKGKDKEIKVYWEEFKAPFKSITSLEISHPKSPYRFANGIKIGTGLNDIAGKNNGPINLYGFGWDYGGTFISFGKGKLAADMPCFGGVFQLKTSDAAAPALMGDHEINSSDPSFKKAEATLTKIRVSKIK